MARAPCRLTRSRSRAARCALAVLPRAAARAIAARPPRVTAVTPATTLRAQLAVLLPFLKAFRAERPHVINGYSNRLSLHPGDNAKKTAEFLERVPLGDFIDSIRTAMRAMSILEKAAVDTYNRSFVVE